MLALVALYGFLGAALWLMWMDLRQAALQGEAPRIRTIRLRISGRTGKASDRVFTQREVLMGRDPASDVLLADKSVSSRHAVLSFHEGQWWLEDLGSRNGTRLNRQRLARSTVVTSGDEIRCGSMRIAVEVPAAGRPRRVVREAEHA
jgi:pSer/pThr/pTyr-binding forkhead associated (FHA) protein